MMIPPENLPQFLARATIAASHRSRRVWHRLLES